MTRFFQLIFISLFAGPCFAQFDSLAVVNARWEKKKIAPGIILKHYWFEGSLFGQNQNINVLEVRLNKKNTFDIAYEPKLLRQTSSFGSESGAIAAINGNFFNMKDGGSVDYVRTEGIVRHQNRLESAGRRALHQKAAIVIKEDDVDLVPWDGTENWEQKLDAPDVMLSGPMLVDRSVPIRHDSTSTYLTRHPRSAIGERNGRILLVTVDGRNEKAAGMNLFELGKFMKWLGCGQAINLDGGGSTTLWTRQDGVVNYPSDNRQMEQSSAFKPGMDLDNLPADEKRWDRSGERPVANAILVKRKK